MKNASKKNKKIEDYVNETESEIVEIMKDNGVYTKNLIYFKLKKLGLKVGHDYSNKLIKKMDLEKLYQIEPDLESEIRDLLNVSLSESKEE